MHRGKEKYLEFSVFIRVLRHKLFLLFKKGMAEHFPAISAGRKRTACKRSQGLLPLTGSPRHCTLRRSQSSKAVSGNGANRAQLTADEEESLSFTVDSTFGQKAMLRIWGETPMTSEASGWTWRKRTFKYGIRARGILSSSEMSFLVLRPPEH